jgi:hypothetical protein
MRWREFRGACQPALAPKRSASASVLAAFELSDAELEAVLAAMRADVQSAAVAVARRALSPFVRMVDADRLVIWYHEPDLVGCTRLQTVPPRGFEPLHQA